MAEVRWTPQAASDLESIATFIAHDSSQYASLFVSSILTAVEQLADFPTSGRVVPEWRTPTIREILSGNFRIVYRVRSDLVEVLTVYHGARLLAPSDLKLP
ncbi:MAG: type II toxin-antitoxin system RelE/ParE family toxin [Lentisphaerae bacterium]|nr:type II toxin-antitoxin system RelE/ParE family toxin [Lentisphaerota bacterium]